MSTPSTVVLTITRQMGSGGAYIGQGVARQLGLKYVDREILQEAARLLGAEDPHNIEHLEERVAGLWARMTRHLSLGPPDALFTPPAPHSSVYEEDLFRVERQIIREIAARENCVIIGRAGAFVLRDHPGVVRVFVHAPDTFRMELLATTVAHHNPGELRDLMRRSDMDRARFVHEVCSCNWSDACHYDLTVNTATVGLDNAVDLVAGVVRSKLAGK
ncbi:MAG: AAA family ATPase [Bacteroidales bacterium]